MSSITLAGYITASVMLTIIFIILLIKARRIERDEFKLHLVSVDLLEALEMIEDGIPMTDKLWQLVNNAQDRLAEVSR